MPSKKGTGRKALYSVQRAERGKKAKCLGRGVAERLVSRWSRAERSGGGGGGGGNKRET